MAKKKRKKLSGRRRAETHKGAFERTATKLPEGTNFFNPKKSGVYRLEIIPYVVPEGAGNPYFEDGEEAYERTFFVHRGIGPENNTYVCPAKTAKRRCPICEHRAELARDPDADEDLIKDLAPKERQLWNVFDHADSDRGVQVWDVSYHLFGKKLDAEIKDSDEDDGYEFFADKDEGMTLRVGMTEKSFGGRTFLDAETINFKPRKKALDPAIFDEACVLDELLIVEDYDKLKSVFLQIDEGNESDDEKPTPPPKRPRKPKKKPTAEELGIERGDEVEHPEFGVCDVVKISGDGTSLTLMDADDGVHKVVSPADVKKVEAVATDDDDWDDDNDDWDDD